MALTRKFLKALDIDEAKIDQIIDAHTETTDALKADRDSYKADAEKLSSVQKKLDEATENAQKLQKALDEMTPYKEKYETEHKAYEDYKKGIDADKVKNQKTEAYKGLLKKAGVKDSETGERYKSIVRATSMDKIELDDKGEVKNSDELIEGIKKEWSEFIATKDVKGANTDNPPHNTGGGMTKEDIMKIKDRNERQKAISENHELFGY